MGHYVAHPYVFCSKMWAPIENCYKWGTLLSSMDYCYLLYESYMWVKHNRRRKHKHK
jgi:hypothetical protein